MEEGELSVDLDVGAALDAAALRPQEHVLEVQLHLVDHVRHLDEGVGRVTAARVVGSVGAMMNWLRVQFRVE